MQGSVGNEYQQMLVDEKSVSIAEIEKICARERERERERDVYANLETPVHWCSLSVQWWRSLGKSGKSVMATLARKALSSLGQTSGGNGPSFCWEGGENVVSCSNQFSPTFEIGNRWREGAMEKRLDETARERTMPPVLSNRQRFRWGQVPWYRTEASFLKARVKAKASCMHWSTLSKWALVSSLMPSSIDQSIDGKSQRGALAVVEVLRPELLAGVRPRLGVFGRLPACAMLLFRDVLRAVVAGWLQRSFLWYSVIVVSSVLLRVVHTAWRGGEEVVILSYWSRMNDFMPIAIKSRTVWCVLLSRDYLSDPEAKNSWS